MNKLELRTKLIRYFLLVGLVLFTRIPDITANIHLPQIFGNNILQYNSPVIWGKADPGENVKVMIGRMKVKTSAGNDGNFKKISITKLNK